MLRVGIKELLGLEQGLLLGLQHGFALGLQDGLPFFLIGRTPRLDSQHTPELLNVLGSELVGAEQDELGAGRGVSNCVVVIERDLEIFGQGVELVVGELRPGRP